MEYERDVDWLLDPLDPHAIAGQRPNAYTHFTLFSIIGCLLDYADAEFTRATSESIPRARTLYMTALDLLESSELRELEDRCEEVIIELGKIVEVMIGSPPSEDDPAWVFGKELVNVVTSIDDSDLRSEALEWIKKEWNRDTGDIDPSPIEQFTQAIVIAQEYQHLDDQSVTYAAILEGMSRPIPWGMEAVIANDEVANRAKAAGVAASQTELASIGTVSDDLSRVDLDRPSATSEAGSRHSTELDPDHLPDEVDEFGRHHLFALSGDDLTRGKHDSLLGEQETVYRPTFFPHFCVPENPILAVLRLRAEFGLSKLRNCMNIAGMQVELEPYATSTTIDEGATAIAGPNGQTLAQPVEGIQPTQYRYKVLIERAKQLVTVAQEMESAFLLAIEKQEDATYRMLNAQQGVELAQEGVELQKLRVSEADEGITLAELQKELSDIQKNHYDDLLAEGLLLQEQFAVGALWTAMGVQLFVTAIRAGLAIGAGAAAGTAAASELGPGAGVGTVIGTFAGAAAQAAADPTAATLSALSGGLSSASSALSMWASFERREQEWEFQQALAEQNVKIGEQQIDIAEAHKDVVAQERDIADLKTDHSETIVEFLDTKFANEELYEWMSGVLEGIYRYFLQQATGVARLAERQLAFQRQENLPAFIRNDYWAVPTEDQTTDEDDDVDRRGMTGSARLLRDIYELDQHAFTTDERKNQLTKTISLSQLDPVQFERFRESGTLTFETPMELFDRDFPGHYLRLIKRVRTSVIALIPPTEGIKATLSNAGISRVVTGDDVFQTNVVRQPPQSVALTSPQNATGLFELQPENPEMLLPFEFSGVDTVWELRLPKAANQFDYQTIADVLVTIEYTALDNANYRKQVIEELDSEISANRVFSFRHEFADQWYDLHNPDQIAETEEPMTVSFETTRADFAPNMDGLEIIHLQLYFPGLDDQLSGVDLFFTEKGSPPEAGVGGEANTEGELISTRRSSAGGWLNIIDGNRTPIGEWTLSLPNPKARDVFTNDGEEDGVTDIVFVVGYSGQTAGWSE